MNKPFLYPTTALHIDANLSSWKKRTEIAQMIMIFRYIIKEYNNNDSDVKGIRLESNGVINTSVDYGSIENVCRVLRIEPN